MNPHLLLAGRLCLHLSSVCIMLCGDKTVLRFKSICIVCIYMIICICSYTLAHPHTLGVYVVEDMMAIQSQFELTGTILSVVMLHTLLKYNSVCIMYVRTVVITSGGVTIIAFVAYILGVYNTTQSAVVPTIQRVCRVIGCASGLLTVDVIPYMLRRIGLMPRRDNECQVTSCLSTVSILLIAAVCFVLLGQLWFNMWLYTSPLAFVAVRIIVDISLFLSTFVKPPPSAACHRGHEPVRHTEPVVLVRRVGTTSTGRECLIPPKKKLPTKKPPRFGPVSPPALTVHISLFEQLAKASNQTVHVIPISNCSPNPTDDSHVLFQMFRVYDQQRIANTKPGILEQYFVPVGIFEFCFYLVQCDTYPQTNPMVATDGAHNLLAAILSIAFGPANNGAFYIERSDWSNAVTQLIHDHFQHQSSQQRWQVGVGVFATLCVAFTGLSVSASDTSEFNKRLFDLWLFYQQTTENSVRSVVTEDAMLGVILALVNHDADSCMRNIRRIPSYIPTGKKTTTPWMGSRRRSSLGFDMYVKNNTRPVGYIETCSEEESGDNAIIDDTGGQCEPTQTSVSLPVEFSSMFHCSTLEDALTTMEWSSRKKNISKGSDKFVDRLRWGEIVRQLVFTAFLQNGDNEIFIRGLPSSTIPLTQLVNWVTSRGTTHNTRNDTTLPIPSSLLGFLTPHDNNIKPPTGTKTPPLDCHLDKAVGSWLKFAVITLIFSIRQSYDANTTSRFLSRELLIRPELTRVLVTFLQHYLPSSMQRYGSNRAVAIALNDWNSQELLGSHTQQESTYMGLAEIIEQTAQKLELCISDPFARSDRYPLTPDMNRRLLLLALHWVPLFPIDICMAGTSFTTLGYRPLYQLLLPCFFPLPDTSVEFTTPMYQRLLAVSIACIWTHGKGGDVLPLLVHLTANIPCITQQNMDGIIDTWDHWVLWCKCLGGVGDVWSGVIEESMYSQQCNGRLHMLPPSAERVHTYQMSFGVERDLHRNFRAISQLSNNPSMTEDIQNSIRTNLTAIEHYELNACMLSSDGE